MCPTDCYYLQRKNTNNYIMVKSDKPWMDDQWDGHDAMGRIELLLYNISPDAA